MGKPIHRITVIICIFVFLCADIFAQEKKINRDFDNTSFNKFINELETGSGYRFYYDSTDTDSVQISISVREKNVQEVLEMALKNTGLYYAIDADKNIFITKKFIVQTKLPAGFAGRQVNDNDTVSQVNSIKTLLDIEDEKKPVLSPENKLFEIGKGRVNAKPGNMTITGYIKNNKTGEAIAGASISVDSPSVSVMTDQFGYYQLSLPKGRYQINISSVNMKDTRRQIHIYSDGSLNIDMHDDVQSLKAVIVVSEKASNVLRLQMGAAKMNIQTIKQVPVVFGEADVLKAVLTLPGVTSVGEASTGFNVRGGAADQNLILFNDMTIYNPAHFFGFFSAFNPDVVKEIELYKSSIPEKYGGRVASVLDVVSKNGNKKKLSGAGGIGPLTSKLTIEGPIIKEKTSFIVGARSTYSNWLMKLIPDDAYKKSTASFYDITAHVNHEINTKNNLYLTAYISNDQFKLNNDTLYKYGNQNINLRWKHIFNSKFNAVFSGGYDSYKYSISGKGNAVNAYDLSFNIKQFNFRSDFTYLLDSKNTLNFGVNANYYKLQPGKFVPVGERSLVVPDILENEQALETAVYLGDRLDLTPELSINLGVRYSMFNYLGPQEIYTYQPGIQKSVLNIADSSLYRSGDMIKTYHGPEFRIGLRYSLPDNASVKLSYNTLRQYIHVLSNTTAISPTDTWKLSDPNIRPQLGQQLSLGFYKNFKSNTIETSVEIYYKKLRDYLDYKSGASLVLNHHIETDVVSTRGKAYGAEFLLKKPNGKLNGWISYTYSRILLTMKDSTQGPLINKGEEYPANYDKPHNINFIGNYKFTHRFGVSLNVVYSTGRPITLPIAIFNLNGSERVFYSDRNKYRVPDYFRTDLSFNIEGNHRIKKLAHSSWTVGIYNLTGRKNPYSVYFTSENGVVKGYKFSIFGTLIPFVTYNFKF